MVKPNKALIVSALVVGLLSTIWAAVAWLPLALGAQVAQYSEYRQGVAIFEFACIILGLIYLIFVLIHSIKAY